MKKLIMLTLVIIIALTGVLTLSAQEAETPQDGVSVTVYNEGTALINLWCQDDAAGGWAGRACSVEERAAQRFVVGPGGSLGESVHLQPRSGMILVPE